MLNNRVFRVVVLFSVILCLFGCAQENDVEITTSTTIQETTTTQPTTEETTTEKVEESTTKVEESTTEKVTEPTTEKEETTTKKEEPTTEKKEEPTTEKKVTYTKRNETVYAKEKVNVRKSDSSNSKVVGNLKKGEKVTRIAVGDNGWSKITYKGETCYVVSSYLTTKKPVEETTKKEEPTTEKKEETTNKNSNKVVAKTDGGIELKEITSDEAKKIAGSYALFKRYKGYEGTSANGKTIVVYINYKGSWFGYDKDLVYYDSSGKTSTCEYCGKQVGKKDNMCNGSCHIEFH